ncbi:hypothetical protein Vretimale_14536 [Volvox reticuliferus]|uniref:Legumain prodomain domain-containing protein n=1 Tax=Volvox reticuliferus TaxID=1737510 RepID=A0A8J4LUT3_9CHLO|nr:hypothetical protein Vretifemale_13277 [Volvox reticuliferus]GIM10945.1 hypothetical protein Vretimale_14536 [Volvox reticuliferus]
MRSNPPIPILLDISGGPNVYDGVRVDYSGADVNAATFLAVLAGNASAVPPGSGSGRVIASGPYDRIFVFYSDHGSPGVLGMPSGSFLYADQLVAALQRKHARGGYKEAVLYVEACESGSMFEGLLPPDIAVYATTASNAFESSWGTYCPGMTPGPSPLFSTCLGDLYSVAWMENAELCDLSHETLMTQYDIVRNRTSRNYTYTMGSHVMQYGSLVITREVAGDYQGMRNRGGGGDHPDGDAASCRAGPGPHPSPSPSPYPSSSSFSSSALTSTSTSHRRDDVSAGGGDEGAVRGAVGTLLRRGGDGDDAVDAAAAAAAAAAIAAGAGTQMDTVAAGEGEGAASREDTMQGAQSWRGRRQGRRRRAAEAEAEAEAATATAEAHLRMRQSGSLEQRDADLAPLRYRQVYGRTPEDRHEAQVALEREVSRRKAVDAAALATATSLLNHHPELTLKVAAAASLAAAKPTNAAVTTTTPGNTLYSSDASNGGLVTMLAKELTNGPMGRPAPGRPLVDDWDCLRAMVAAWGDVCGPMDQYTMRHTRLLANLCNAGLAPALLAQSLKNAVAAGFGGEGVGGEGVGRIF